MGKNGSGRSRKPGQSRFSADFELSIDALGRIHPKLEWKLECRSPIVHDLGAGTPKEVSLLGNVVSVSHPPIREIMIGCNLDTGTWVQEPHPVIRNPVVNMV